MTQTSDNQPIDPPENFDLLRRRIRDRFAGLSPHLQRIARASLEDPNGFALKTTPVLAGELGIQPSTLIRFAKEFDFSGFSDLQKVFRQRLIEGQAQTRDQVMSQDQSAPAPDAEAMLEACIASHHEALKQVARDCDLDALNKAVGLLNPARHIYIAGLRRSRPIGDYFLYGLLRGERAASLLDFSGGMAGPQVSTIARDEVLFAIAFPPYSQPVVDVVLDAHVSNRRVVVLTDSPDSPLTKNADVALFVATDTASRFQPISGAVALIQTIVTAITT